MTVKAYRCCDYPNCHASVAVTGQEFPNLARWKLDGSFAYCPLHAVSGPSEHKRNLKKRKIAELRAEADNLEKELDRDL